MTNASINIICGNNTKLQRDNHASFVIGGSSTHIRDNETITGSSASTRGVTMMSNGSTLYVSKKRSINNQQLVDHFIQGVVCLGSDSDVWGCSSWKDIKDAQGNPVSGEGVQNDGVFCAGASCTIAFTAYNYGVALTGHGTVLDDTQNFGVFITGTVYQKSAALFDDEHNRVSIDGKAVEHKDITSGPGIYIRGVIYDPTKNKTVGNSLIQFSSNNGMPTTLKGCLELDKSVSIKDANGNFIIRNGVRQS